ncbi:MAG: tetratricopeptide repeat protein [Steroidobacteraceae bacterium]
MVYGSTMIPALALLLLSAAGAPEEGVAEPAAPLAVPPASTIPIEASPAPPAEPPAASAATGDTTAPASSPPPAPTKDTTAPAPAPAPTGSTTTPGPTAGSGTDKPADASATPTAGSTTAAGTAPPAAPCPRARDQAHILPLDPRLEAYEEFRGFYETARFDEALPFAKRVVELSENDPERDYELPIAYNNLGATQYQLADYAAAAESYQKSLELLETSQGISSRRLIVPLAGLGAVYAAQDQHALAAELLDRALAVSRRADGLFNLNQLPMIEQLADSRYAIDDFSGVEHERLYALKIAEQNYGYNDERTLPPVLDLASFYETLREFIAARMMYLRARDISVKESGGFSPLAVKSLLGIARTHRMQYTMDPETLDSQLPARDEITGDVVGKVWRESRLPPPAADRTGLRAAQQALEMLRQVSDPPPKLLSDTLIELGDWYQSTSRPTLSLPYYAEASGIFAVVDEGAGLGNPLVTPRMVFYRPPVSAARGLNTLTGQYIIRKTVFSFVVSESGEPQDITVVSSNMSEAQLSQSRRALSRAIYSPRFVGGKAVATEAVNFTSDWYEEQEPDPPSTPATTSASSSGT